MCQRRLAVILVDDEIGEWFGADLRRPAVFAEETCYGRVIAQANSAGYWRA